MMGKRIGLGLVAVATGLVLHAQHQGQQLLFNSGWKFHKGDVAAAVQENFDDSSWRIVDLPHDWSIEGPFSSEWASATAYLPGGIGWYRKTFPGQPDWKGKKVYVYFDGVYKNSEVWLNGRPLGKRPNGFIPFYYDLTPYLTGGQNTIAVKADHTEFADSRWYTGSGIYRNVYLLVTAPVHVDLWGVAFSTPGVSASSAEANVNVTIRNHNKTTGAITVNSTLTDKTGKVIAKGSKTINDATDTTANADMAMRITNPSLWSVEAPYLYTLTVTLSTHGKKLDEWKEQVGIRSIRFDADKGFALNGVYTKLKGVCIHDDAGALGVAVPKEVWIRRLEALKAGGCNSLRLSHNPHADYMYDLCDQMGFLVMDEAFDEWEEGKNKWIKGWNKGQPGKDGYHEYFKEWADRDVRDMIMRNRNHPSIIMWSIGNEIDYPNDPYSDPILSTGNNPQIFGKGYLPDHPPAARLGELSARLVKVAKTYDTTRPITAALAGVIMSNTTSYPGNLDVVGYNYQEYRYAEDHAKYPQRVMYGSENGMQLNAWNAVDSNAFISAQYLWTGIDYMGEAGEFPNRSNTAGLLDLGGFRKPEYYFRQSLWSTTPMIYIGTSDIPKSEDRGIWSHKKAAPVWSGKPGDSVRVNCFTNCDEAVLWLNNQLLGKKKLQDSRSRILSWDVPFEPGTLVVKGYSNGKQVAADTLATTGAPVALKATAYQHTMIDNKTGLKQIEVMVADAKGRLVYGAANEISVSTTGGATVIGMESGDASSTEDYKASKRKAMNGRLMVYVKPSTSSPHFTVTIATEGLATAVLTF